MKAYLGDEKVVVVPDGVVQIGGTLSEAEKNWPSRLIIGNHDYEAGILLSNLYKLDEEECPEKLIELYGEWLSDGGKSTLSEYLKLSEKQQQDVIRAIQNMKQYDEIIVNDKRYLLSHTAPGVERAKDYKIWTLEECILGYVDYEDR